MDSTLRGPADSARVSAHTANDIDVTLPRDLRSEWPARGIGRNKEIPNTGQKSDHQQADGEQADDNHRDSQESAFWLLINQSRAGGIFLRLYRFINFRLRFNICRDRIRRSRCRIVGRFILISRLGAGRRSYRGRFSRRGRKLFSITLGQITAALLKYRFRHFPFWGSGRRRRIRLRGMFIIGRQFYLSIIIFVHGFSTPIRLYRSTAEDQARPSE